jgi:hypothetical protein
MFESEWVRRIGRKRDHHYCIASNHNDSRSPPMPVTTDIDLIGIVAEQDLKLSPIRQTGIVVISEAHIKRCIKIGITMLKVQ